MSSCHRQFNGSLDVCAVRAPQPLTHEFVCSAINPQALKACILFDFIFAFYIQAERFELQRGNLQTMRWTPAALKEAGPFLKWTKLHRLFSFKLAENLFCYSPCFCGLVAGNMETKKNGSTQIIKMVCKVGLGPTPLQSTFPTSPVLLSVQEPAPSSDVDTDSAVDFSCRT